MVKDLNEVRYSNVIRAAIDFINNNLGDRLTIESIARILEKLGMKEAFDAVVTGDDVQLTKPDPQGFILAAQRLHVKPECCVVIEDAFAGLQGAKSAGMKAIGIGDPAILTNADVTLPTTGALSLDVLRRLF